MNMMYLTIQFNSYTFHALDLLCYFWFFFFFKSNGLQKLRLTSVYSLPTVHMKPCSYKRAHTHTQHIQEAVKQVLRLAHNQQLSNAFCFYLPLVFKHIGPTFFDHVKISSSLWSPNLSLPNMCGAFTIQFIVAQCLWWSIMHSYSSSLPFANLSLPKRCAAVYHLPMVFISNTG